MEAVERIEKSKVRESENEKDNDTLIAAAMICALASCGSGTDQTQHQPEAETETEDDTLKSLRKTIVDSGSQMGIAFLGTMAKGIQMCSNGSRTAGR